MADRETTRQTIRENWRTIIPTLTAPARDKVNGETSWICPICGHGAHGDGLTRNPQSKDGNGLKCFGCGFSGDIIDLYQQTSGADYNTALSSLAALLGITIDGGFTPKAPAEPRRGENSGRGNDGTPPQQKAPENAAETPKTAKADFTAYFALCCDRLDDPAAVAYLNGRGISLDTAKRAGLGFDPAADPANAPGAMGGEYKPHPCPRIIERNSKGGYTGRSIDPENQYKKVIAQGSGNGLFCLPSLYAQEAQIVFITEGAFDALSLMEIGRAAVALNSANQADAFAKQITAHRPKATLVLCLDNDAAGQKAERTISAACKAASLDCISANICGKYKDPNEALTADKEAFLEAVEAAESKAIRPDNTASYLDFEMQKDAEKLKESVSTGFSFLDAAAGGGLYPGLYTLAAISGLGKTTFALQMADQIAGLRISETGEIIKADPQHPAHDVLFFSLEQSRLELVSKSLARTVAQMYGAESGAVTPTSLQIRYGLDTGDIAAAKQIYRNGVQDRVSIIQGDFGNDVSYIRGYIEKHIQRTRTRPVCIVDYLQILAPAKEAKWHSTKEAVDSTVTELKRISRDYSVPVIAISSMSREYYKQPVTFESLKESGGIEYTSDCVLGLQLYCLDDPSTLKDQTRRQEAIDRAKDARPRILTLKCLKNRNGPLYQTPFLYYPDLDLYLQADEVKIRKFLPPPPFAAETRK